MKHFINQHLNKIKNILLGNKEVTGASEYLDLFILKKDLSQFIPAQILLPDLSAEVSTHSRSTQKWTSKKTKKGDLSQQIQMLANLLESFDLDLCFFDQQEKEKKIQFYRVERLAHKSRLAKSDDLSGEQSNDSYLAVMFLGSRLRIHLWAVLILNENQYIKYQKEMLRLDSIKEKLVIWVRKNYFINHLLEEEFLIDLDHLTELYNQRKLMIDLEYLIKSNTVQNKSFYLYFLDIDYFKNINDRYGHLMGSHVLKTIAAKLREVVGNAGQIYRYGGDEFVIMAIWDHPLKAKHLGEKIVKVFSETYFPINDDHFNHQKSNTQDDKAFSEQSSFNHSLGHFQYRITFSIGMSCFPRDGKNVKDILGRADQLLYKAKAQGRNCLVGSEDLLKTIASPKSPSDSLPNGRNNL